MTAASDSQVQLPGGMAQHCIIFLKEEDRGDTDGYVQDVAPTPVPRNMEELLKVLYKPTKSETDFLEDTKKSEATLANEEEVEDLACTLDSRLDFKIKVKEAVKKPLWRPDPYKDIRPLLLPDLTIPQVHVVKQYDLSADDYSSESDEPQRKSWKIPTRLKYPDLNMYSKDYWSARKKVRNLRTGNDLSIVVTLELMMEMDFKNQELLYGITDAGGIETILNIVEGENLSCQINGLKILIKLSDDEITRGIMVNQGVADVCFKLLSHGNSEIVLASSTIIYKLCSLLCMRAYCRKSRALEILLEFAELEDRFLILKEVEKLGDIERRYYDVGVNCLRSIDRLYNSKAVRLALYRLGFVRLLKKLIVSQNDEFYKMGIRMLTLSASIELYIQIFIDEGFMDFVFKLYVSKDPTTHLQMLKIVHKCLDNVHCKHWMLKRGLFTFLVDEFKTTSQKVLKYTMACIMRFANMEKYRQILDNHGLISRLFSLFDHPSAKIRDYAGSLLGQLSRYPKNFQEIAGPQNIGVMKLFEYVQTNTDYVLIGHLYKVLCDLSYDDKIYWDICDTMDPIAVLWGGVTANHPKIHEHACSALVPYIGPLPDSIERVVRIPGSIHDLLNITYETDDGAKAGAITLLARICQNGIMFKTLIQEGFDQRLLELARTAKHPRLRYAIGYGFGACARTERMSFSLGKRGAVDILLDWLMNDSDKYAQLGIITGLWKLSYEPINCKIIIQAKVVERLTYLAMGMNECLQNSIAGLLVNMRYLARAAELMKNKHRVHPPEPGIGVAPDPDIIHPFQYADDPDDALA